MPLEEVPSSVERGSLLVLEIADPPALPAEEVVRWARELRRTLAAPVFLRVPADALEVAALLLAHGLRGELAGLVLPGVSVREMAWRILPNPQDLAREWIGWLRLFREVSPGAATYVHLIVTHAPEHPSLRTLLESQGKRRRTVRHRLHAEGLPSPGRWFHAARLLEGQLRLQRDPGLSVYRAATALGYGDAESFSSQVYRVFGATAQRSRGLLGVEWRFREWWRRVGEGSQGSSTPGV